MSLLLRLGGSSVRGGLKAFCKRDISREGRNGEKLEHITRQKGNQGSRINYYPPKVLSQTDFPMFSVIRLPSLCVSLSPLQHVSVTTAAAVADTAASARNLRSGGRAFSSFCARWELFLIDSHRRPRQFHRRRRRRRCQSRRVSALGKQVPPPVFFTGFKDGRKRPRMGITTEKYPGSLSSLPSCRRRRCNRGLKVTS